MHGEVIPTGAALGAEIKGLDLSKPLTALETDLIREAWLDHSVLLFRDQTLDDDALIEFSRRFGKLGIEPSQRR